MTFYQQLEAATEAQRQYLLSSPIIQRCMTGNITLDEYVTFLSQAFHHVKHTVPLLMNVGARLSEQFEWVRPAVAEYIEEEIGHEEWILNDISACGYDKQQVRASKPLPATELMVSYAYDCVNRIEPMAFFGMVKVLEGTSVQIADKAADIIQSKLNLPDRAFSYLRSHGAIDLEHIVFFEKLMNRIDDTDTQAKIIHAANMFYGLYAEIFRSIPSQDSTSFIQKQGEGYVEVA